MGVIFALLLAHRALDGGTEVPLWVVLACHAAMALGTLAGGWRIVRTMGMRLTKLKPVHGFAAADLWVAGLSGLRRCLRSRRRLTTQLALKQSSSEPFPFVER